MEEYLGGRRGRALGGRNGCVNGEIEEWRDATRSKELYKDPQTLVQERVTGSGIFTL